MSDTSLSHYVFDDCLWVRCATRGSFVNSPALKSLADKYLAGGGNTIIVDLEVCPGVDSTFMGTLAGLAQRTMSKGGCLQVASPTSRTRSAMESLGLDMLIDIDPENAFWRADAAERRARLADAGNADSPEHDMSELARTRHVLEAHNTLRAMNTRNDATFGYVCETLEEDLMRHEGEEDEK